MYIICIIDDWWIYFTVKVYNTGCSKKKETFFEHLPQEHALNISSKNSIWSKPYNLWTLLYTTDMVTKKPLQRKQCNVFFWPRGTKKEGQRIFRKKTFTTFFKAKKGLFYVRFWSQFLPFLKQYFKTLFESINALIKPCYRKIYGQ